MITLYKTVNGKKRKIVFFVRDFVLEKIDLKNRKVNDIFCYSKACLINININCSIKIQFDELNVSKIIESI